MRWLAFLADKFGSLGVVVAAMGCAYCYPVFDLGIGSSPQWEELSLNTLLPLFATIVLAANLLSFDVHRIWRRMLIGITGPMLVLASLYLFWNHDWHTSVFYVGVAMMVGVSLFDLVRAPRRAGTVSNGADSAT